MNVDPHFPKLPMGGPRLRQPFSGDVRLHKAKNAWRPSARRLGEGSRDWGEEVPEEACSQVLFRKMHSILNKLSPEVFPLLAKQASELNIDTEERLRGIGTIIFEKAIAEVKFCSTYAQLCHHLREINVPSSESPAILNLSSVLLKLCQVEFNKLEVATLESEVNGHRHRSLGNMQFLGELFKLKMMKEEVIHSFVTKHLSNRSGEALECLCCLLTIVGQNLGSDKDLMDGYFHSVSNIIKEGRTSSRIRFLLQDVLELRRNDWICRRREDRPKTIEQVHRQADMERQRGRRRLQQAHPWRHNWCHRGQDLWVQVKPHPAWSPSCLQKEELPKEEKVRKPAVKRLSVVIRDRREEDPETARTQELYRSMHSVLDKLTPKIFGHMMKQVNKLHINTEERLRGIAAIIFQKAISEPRFSATCAKMCHCLRELNAPSAKSPQDFVNFHLVLLELCHMELQKMYEDHEEKQHQQLVMKFMGELFKLKMMKETVIHNAITKLLITQSEVALKCLCCLLSTFGSNLDCKEEQLMDGYIHQMEEIITKRQIPPQISCLMQNIVALRKNYWFPLKPVQTCMPDCQASMESKLEEMQERIQEQRLVIPMAGSDGPGGAQLSLRHDIHLQDEGQNTAIIPANYNLEPCTFIQLDTLDFHSQLPIPRWEGTRWGHGMEHEMRRLSCSTLNLLPTLLLSSSFSSSLHTVHHRRNWSQDCALVKWQFNQPDSLGSSSDDTHLQVLGAERHALQTVLPLPAPANPADGTDEASNPAPALAVTTQNELEKVAKAADMKEMLLCVKRRNGTLQLLMVEQNSINSNCGITIRHLAKVGPLPPQQLLRLQRILQMEPHRHHIMDHVVTALHQLPHRGYIPMDQLLREVSVPPVPLDRTGDQKLEILFLMENQMEEEKQRQQLVTNMKFTGEHFKLRMMKETVIHNVITKLLITQSEVALECLCRLLSTIGSTLDCDEEQFMDGYIHQLEEIITTRQISSQVIPPKAGHSGPEKETVPTETCRRGSRNSNNKLQNHQNNNNSKKNRVIPFYVKYCISLFFICIFCYYLLPVLLGVFRM